MGGSASSSEPGKTRFDDIYDRPDPRAYFQRLGPLAYEIPHHAQEVFRRIREERSAASGGVPVTVLDVCCSYGINAALLNHDLTLDDLYAHYTGAEALSPTRAELVDRDKEFYRHHRRADAGRVIGLDTASNALRYALDVGLLDEAYAENLEERPPGAALRRALATTGLITLTGGGSYITHRTFGALLEAARMPVWVCAFVLRTVNYRPVAELFEAHGLVTESDPSWTYPQRLFTSSVEQADAIERVRRAGEDPAGRESEGRYYARLYLSRPRPRAS
ncbi:hypothetical protein [Streptomyces purpureus]|uniref:hypothetical protein n=1 Tax=Streptomyces purpureus TaxID=1951 RepID=UPI0003720DCD|nr:hypothetical protein [Streptomyces purpureus]